MKKILIIVFLVFVSCLYGCSEPKYHEKVGWDVNDEVFLSEYFTFYTTTITELATSYDIDIEQEIEYIEDYGFCISYKTEDMEFFFDFINSSMVIGRYWSRFVYFHENTEDVFDFELYRNYLNLISDVNAIVSYDYQEIDDVYYELYIDVLNGLGNRKTFYFDSIVGYIGYHTSWGDYYSSSNPSAYIHFDYNALLKVQDI